MRSRLLPLLVLLTLVGCAGPGMHTRGGHHGGYHHHHGGGPGFLALLEGAVALADIAADVSYIAAASSPPPPAAVVVVPAQPAPVETVRSLPPRFQGSLALQQSSRVTLPELRMGLRPTSGGTGSYLAVFYSDLGGRFSFVAPPAGKYTLEVLDFDYLGQLTFASDGRTTFPIVLPIAARPKQPVSAPQVGLSHP